MKRRNTTLIVLFFIVVVSYGRGYHVTIDGKSTGDGSEGNPWNLEAAFDRKNPIKPGGGDTIFIHGGVHVGTTHVWFGGELNNHVVITNWQNEDAVIDGNTGLDDAAVIYIQNEGGGYVTIDGLVVTNSHSERYTNVSGSFPPHPQNMAGIQSAAPNYTIKNCVIHNNHGNGIGGFGGNAEITGNIIYHNGWDAPDRGHCYGLYVQNDDPNKVVNISNNIIYANFNKGTHVYVTKGTIIQNININDNISFEAGSPSSDGAIENCIFVGGLVPLKNVEVNDNHTYLSRNDRGNCVRLGYYDQDNKNLTFSGNYMTGGYRTLTIRYWEDIEVSNNFLFSKNYWLTELHHNDEDLSEWIWNSNDYYYTGSRKDYMNGDSWNNWSYKDDSCEVVEGRPTNFTDKYHIKYSPIDGNIWATMVVYDWDKKGSINVDLSTILDPGSNYAIYDVQNIRPTNSENPSLIWEPVVEGIYQSNDIVAVPTNLTKVAQVIGEVDQSIKHTDREFNVFVIKSDQFTRNQACELSFTSISPDPTNGIVDVVFEKTSQCLEPVTAYLFSPYGEFLKTFENVSDNFNINLMDICPLECESGLYGVQLKCGNYLTTVKKFQYIKKETFKILSYSPNPTEGLVNIVLKAKEGSVINWKIKTVLGYEIMKNRFNTDTMKTKSIGEYNFIPNFQNIEKGKYKLYMDDGFSKDSCEIIKR